MIMIKPVKRISIYTGGGDASGLNAVIYAAVHAASRLGWQVLGIREGYDGLPTKLDFVPLAEAVAELKLVPLDGDAVLTARALGICFGD